MNDEAQENEKPEHWEYKLNTLRWNRETKQGERATCEACGDRESYMHILNDDRKEGALCDECFHTAS